MPPLAPVILFAYARPDHLRATLESLQRDPLAGQTHVTVYCDAPKHAGHAAGVQAVRALVSQAQYGFSSFTPVYREFNLGLARSVIAGVTEALQHSERVIVLEDDLVLSPCFLDYMNSGLDRYAADTGVASIHGYSYPTAELLPETFFLRGADCWGWATWRRAWMQFEADGERLLRALRARGLTRRFDMDGAYPYTRMLEDQIAGRNDSWAIRWHASCFLAEMLTLHPGRSLVENIGNDGSGTHRGDTDIYSRTPSVAHISVERLPLVENQSARAIFVRFLRQRHPHWTKRIARRLRALWGDQ